MSEQDNIDLVCEYVEIAYPQGRASAQAVGHLCAPNNRFIAPTTFPGVTGAGSGNGLAHATIRVRNAPLLVDAHHAATLHDEP